MNKITLNKILVFLFIFSFVVVAPAAQAASLDDLQNEKDQLTQDLQNAQSAAANKQKEAKTLQGQVGELESDISNTQKKVDETGGQISEKQSSIQALSGSIDKKKLELNDLKKKLNAAIVEIYRSSGRSNLELLFSGDNLGEASNEGNYIESVQLQVKVIYGKVKGIKQDLEKQKSDEEQKKAELDQLKNQQVAYQKSTEYQKTQKDKLLGMTVEQQKQYLDLAAKYQKQINQVQAQMGRLRDTKNWGTQIVSGSGISWYYSQIGNYTRLGNSPFTVNDYGCLITSIAMVATYHSHHISPTDMATTYGSFSEEGYLLSVSPAIGVSISGSRSINWSEVDSQISAGRPVIISVYLPSVGPINNDGSSHFVVIYGRSGDSYLMADPISSGRGYNMDQIRSMKLVSP